MLGLHSPSVTEFKNFGEDEPLEFSARINSVS
jgi:hypothetical protein